MTSACSRRLSLGGEGNGQGDSRDLPFHGDADSGGPGEAASHSTTLDQRDTSSNPLPFNSSTYSVLPAGTLLTVRLESTLGSAKPDRGNTFLAVVEEPVTVDGRTVIPRDSEVKGRVESSRVSNTDRRMGYLRLTLDSIRVGDKQIPVSTSSLFARAIIGDDDDSATPGSRTRPVAARPGTIRLQKGRRLTFRLTAPLDLSKPPAADYKAQSGTK